MFWILCGNNTSGTLLVVTCLQQANGPLGCNATPMVVYNSGIRPGLWLHSNYEHLESEFHLGTQGVSDSAQACRDADCCMFKRESDRELCKIVASALSCNSPKRAHAPEKLDRLIRCLGDTRDDECSDCQVNGEPLASYMLWVMEF